MGRAILALTLSVGLLLILVPGVGQAAPKTAVIDVQGMVCSG